MVILGWELVNLRLQIRKVLVIKVQLSMCIERLHLLFLCKYCLLRIRLLSSRNIGLVFLKKCKYLDSGMFTSIDY